MNASRRGNLVEVKALLKNKGANPNKPNENGATALSFAVYNGHLKVVWALLEAGGNIDERMIDLARKRGHTLILRTLKKPPMELNRPKSRPWAAETAPKKIKPAAPKPKPVKDDSGWKPFLHQGE